jgi:spermidine/putrescine-binding protein
MKNKLLLALAALTLAAVFNGCGSASSDNSLVVLNYGKYVDPDVLDAFEEETGITVQYEEYESPEEMYTKYKAGSIDYDLICTSDYMIQKLIEEDEVIPMNFDNIPGVENLDKSYFEFSRAFDPENKYSMPYFFGTVGILYNTTMVDASEVDTWDVLWDEKYSGQIIMENSVRDSFMVPLKRLGYSLNATDENQLNEALDMLIEQKPMVYAYFVDESEDEMVAGNAAMALVYSGEAAAAQTFNDDLDYAVPKEGSNMWIDSWFMPKTCKNQENAEKFLDFLCREDMAMKNFEYVYYATPNTAVFNALDEETQQDTTIFPPKEVLDNCEVLDCLDSDAITLYNDLWKKLKSD